MCRVPTVNLNNPARHKTVCREGEWHPYPTPCVLKYLFADSEAACSNPYQPTHTFFTFLTDFGLLLQDKWERKLSAAPLNDPQGSSEAWQRTLEQDSYITVESCLPRNNKSIHLETFWQLLLRRQFLCASILSVLTYAPGDSLKYQPKSCKWSGYADKLCLDLWVQKGLAKALTSLWPVVHVDIQKTFKWDFVPWV